MLGHQGELSECWNKRWDFRIWGAFLDMFFNLHSSYNSCKPLYLRSLAAKPSQQQKHKPLGSAWRWLGFKGFGAATLRSRRLSEGFRIGGWEGFFRQREDEETQRAKRLVAWFCQRKQYLVICTVWSLLNALCLVFSDVSDDKDWFDHHSRHLKTERKTRLADFVELKKLKKGST